MGAIGHLGALGRERDLRRAVTQLVAGRGVVVLGSTGSGRTAFAGAVADIARRKGAAPLWITGTETMRTAPFGALGWLTGERGFRTSADTIGSFVAAMRYHGGHGLTVVVVDDAHLLDDESATAILQAVSSRGVSVVVTADGAAPMPEPLTHLVRDRFAESIDLAPFDREAVAEVAAAMVGGPVSTSTAELLWQWSGGLPAALAAIIETGVDEGRFAPVGGQWWWHGAAPSPGVVSSWMQRRLSDVSEVAADALDMLALAEWMDVAEIEALVGSDGLVELEKAALVDTFDQGAGMIVRCNGGLIASLRVDKMPPLRRRRMAQRVLDALPRPVTAAEIARMARLCLHTGQPAPSDLLLSAASLVRLSDPQLAHRFGEVCHRWAPGVASTVGLLFNRLEEGEFADAAALLEQARALAVTDGDRVRLVESEFNLILFGSCDPDAACEVLERADRDAVLPLRSPLALSMRSLAELLAARPREALRFAAEANADPSCGDVPRLRAGFVAGAAELFQGNTGESLRWADSRIGSAEAQGPQLPTALSMLRAAIAFARLWRGELMPLPSAHPSNGRWPMPPGIVEREADRQFSWALMAGIAAHLRGEHTEAVARLREAVVQQAAGKGLFHAEAAAWLVVALCDAGDRNGAEVALRSFPERRLAMLPGLREWAGGVVACAQGRQAEGAALLSAAATAAERVGASLCEAVYLMELAGRCDTDAPIGRLDELSRSVDAALLQLLCRAAIAGLKGDVDGLLEAAADLVGHGLVGRARSIARNVDRLARASGNQAAVRRAAQLRRQIGGDTSAAPSHGLTGRESEVAGLAAGGLTDRQIAARLVVSVRTVESHLASSYRKLGVSSRADLAGVLG
jgi:DNA-binding CsgD family transcriptional regulator